MNDEGAYRAGLAAAVSEISRDVEPCPVQDVPQSEPESASGPPSLETEQPVSLPEAILALAVAISENNKMLGQIVAQNAELIEMISDKAEEEDAPLRDLSGRLIG